MSKIDVFVVVTKDLNIVANKFLDILNNLINKEILNKKVLLKPNAVGPYPPAAGVTTSPEIISALKDKLLENNYEVKIGDCPGESAGTTEAIFEKTEILTASGDNFINLGQEAVVVDFPCRDMGNIAIAKAIVNNDVVVSCAKFKTSCFMMFSGAVKNLYGIIPGTQKAQIHNEFPKRDDFADMLIDLAAIPSHTMAVIDGSTVMEGNGPVHGDLRIEDLYILSEDIFAADYVMAQLLGLKIEEVPVLKRALKRGILLPENIEIISDIGMPLPNIKLPVTLASYLEETFVNTDEQVEHIAEVKIVIDKEKCICCGHCANVCPAQAISMNPYPEIDHNKCIRCYCCNELCPVGAAKPQEDIKKLWDKIMGGETES